MTPQVIEAHQLTEPEYDKIVALLGREPTYTELGIFSVMWSEHCSYKSSRVHLKKLPTRSKLVLQGPGENAGIIDIGDGYAIAFKIESHNHPSFIEPFQGADLKLPTRSKLVLQGPGENAGIIDIGDGYAIAFKIESHNHPSFIEPFQGAATGVG